MNEPRIVTVHLTPAPTPTIHQARYAILCDRSAYEIKEFSRKNPRCFVFSFITETDGCPDMNALTKGGTSHYILQPIAVGNLTPINRAIEQFVENMLPVGTEWVKVLDETPS